MGILDPRIRGTEAEQRTSEELGTLNESIKGASIASNKNSLAMKCLTAALVFLGLAQVIVAYLNYHSEQRVIETKKHCYQNVLQASDINLNYKSCLRSQGLSD